MLAGVTGFNEEYRQTYSRLQIPVGKAAAVHEVQAFQNLKNDIPALFLWQWRIKILVQVAIWKIFHGYEYIILGIVPPERLDKILLILNSTLVKTFKKNW